MLQAKTNEGELITLASLTNAELTYHKQNQRFFCPSCNEQVIMKVGSKVIPHFAHRSKVNCPSHEGGEGPYHEKGKHLLYQWLKQQHLNVRLEVYLPEINQRPDLFLTIETKQIAIEFQCARVSVDQIKKRNEGYKQAGITPIWIVGANCFKRLTEHHLKIDQFLLRFIHQFSPEFPLTLYFFCPNTNQLISFQDIQLTRMNQAIGKFHITLLKHTNFTDLFNYYSIPQPKLYQLWKKEKRRFRLQQRHHLHGKELAWHKWLYLKRTHLEYLPSIIHLPVPSQYLMMSEPWDWQSRFCIDVLHPIPVGGQFSIQTCEHILRKNFISPRSFPLIKSNADPLKQYLHILEHLKIIKQLSSHHFTKIQPLSFHKSIEASLKADEKVMDQLVDSIVSKIEA